MVRKFVWFAFVPLFRRLAVWAVKKVDPSDRIMDGIFSHAPLYRILYLRGSTGELSAYLRRVLCDGGTWTREGRSPS